MSSGCRSSRWAQRLGISPSYLNLIEHDQRNVTASLLIKLAEMLRVDLAALSGAQERELEVGLREVFSDPHLGIEQVPDAELEAVAANPGVARGVLALYRAWRVAREDASGLALPSGRRILLPNEEARDVFHERANYFDELEAVADGIAMDMNVAPAETNHALAERLRRLHQVSVRVSPMENALRRYEPETRSLTLSEQLPRESRGFHMAFQVVLLEARETVEALLATIAPSTPGGRLAPTHRPAELRGRLPAHALCGVPRQRPHAQARHGGAGRALLRLLRAGLPPAVHDAEKRGAGYPVLFPARRPGRQCQQAILRRRFPLRALRRSCPRWVVHAAFATPGAIRVQVAQLPDGATFLCFAKAIEGPAAAWGEAAADACHRHGLRRVPGGRRGLCRRAEPGTCRRRHRPVLPPVRQAELPQPGVSAAGTPARAGPESGKRFALPVRTRTDRVTLSGQPPVLPILFQDERFVVLDKPAGLPVHGGPRGGASVEDVFPALSRRRAGPWLAHRLDSDTAGCLVIALRRAALLAAQAAFAEGRAEKTYWAVVDGGPAADAGTIELALTKTEPPCRLAHGGRCGGAACCHRLARAGAWRVAELARAAAAHRRTHQVRVHCAHLGCPVAGDPVYGRAGAGDRLQLLARRIRLDVHPVLDATAPPPPHMQAALDVFGSSPGHERLAVAHG